MKSRVYNWFKMFVDLALIPSLNVSKDEMQENEPYKYETLRDISEIVISNILKKFLYYHQEIDALLPSVLSRLVAT